MAVNQKLTEEKKPTSKSSCMGGAKAKKPAAKKPVAKKPAAKKPVPAKAKKPVAKKGGSVLSDVSKLAVPFGLIAAKSSLEAFLKNRKSRKPPAQQVKPKA